MKLPAAGNLTIALSRQRKEVFMRAFFLTLATLSLVLLQDVLESRGMAGRYTYIFKIQTPTTQEPLRGWRVLYKGDSLMFHESLTKIIEKQCIFTFSLVVTPEIRCVRPTILAGLCHLELIPGNPIRWFDLSLRFAEGVWSWQIAELLQDKIPQRLPHHALILLFDPSLVKSLENPHKTAYCLDGVHETGHCTFEMPSLVLEGSEARLHEAMLHLQHALAGVGAHHLKRPCLERIIGDTYCAIDVL